MAANWIPSCGWHHDYADLFWFIIFKICCDKIISGFELIYGNFFDGNRQSIRICHLKSPNASESLLNSYLINAIIYLVSTKFKMTFSNLLFSLCCLLSVSLSVFPLVSNCLFISPSIVMSACPSIYLLYV